MSLEVPKCKITVVKRTINQDLIDEYLEDAYQDVDLCERFEEGQEFVIEGEEELGTVPEGFCAWAWGDIRNDMIAVVAGADMPGFKRRGTIITGCTDWWRPVIFKVERIEPD